MALHISISAEPIFHLGPVPITNSMLVSWIVTGGLCTFALLVHRHIKQTKKPKGLQNFIEMVIDNLLDLTAGIAGERKARLIFPYVATFFLFILLGNWAGLIPGVGTIFVPKKETVIAVENKDGIETEVIKDQEPIADDEVAFDVDETDNQTDNHSTAAPSSPESESQSTSTQSEPHSEVEYVPLFRGATADLNITLALALASVGLTQYVGLSSLGIKYLSKFINFQNPIQFFIGILELVAEFAKIMSFAFRLFGNIFAGEVLLSVMAFLVPLFAPLPFLGLEIFVGLVQALVFAMLTLVFMNLATASHSQEH